MQKIQNQKPYKKEKKYEFALKYSQPNPYPLDRLVGF